MTIQEVFDNHINKEKHDNGYNHPDSIDIGEQLNLNVYDWEEIKEIKEYPIYTWLCTDTYVGMEILVMDDKPIAITTQEGRKCDKHYMWINQESADKVRQLIIDKYMKHDEMNKVSTFQMSDTVIDIFNKNNHYGCSPEQLSDEEIIEYHKPRN